MLKCADQRPESQPSRAPYNCREKDVGQGSAARHAKVPGNETGAQFRPRGRGSCRLRFDLGVWTRARDSLGAGDYKAHVQVS